MKVRRANTINQDKMLKHLDRVVGDRRPITADVFITNFCNNDCPYCTYKRWELDAEAWAMPLEDFKAYAGRLLELGVKGMILTGGGEPTIHPDFDRITEWLEEQGVSYGINTNFNVLRYFKPDYLKVSLDAWDEESYEAARGVRAYEKVRKNIDAYAGWKRTYSPDTKLGIQLVATDPEQVEKFYEANKDLDVDYIVVRPVESTGGEYYRGGYNRADVREIKGLIRDLRRLDRRVTANYKWNMLSLRYEECLAHWAQIAIDERGNVIYCCHKPYEVVGHILDEDILERYEEARTDMEMCDVPCRLTAPNLFMQKVNAPTDNPSFI